MQMEECIKVSLKMIKKKEKDHLLGQIRGDMKDLGVRENNMV